MIPADIGAEIARLLRAAAAAGDLPERASALPAAGTWRPAPAPAGGGPGTYATSLPFEIARTTGRSAEAVAAMLAAGLGAMQWIRRARANGGYLTITVTAGHLAALPARIVAAGPDVVRGGDLAGTRITAPSLPDLAAAAGWDRAWQTQRDALAGRLAEAAGATVLFIDPQRNAIPDSAARRFATPVAAAAARHGADAVRYALARASAARPRAIERQLSLPLDLDNPFVLVRYAHADATSTLRWAADLGQQPASSHPPVPGRALLLPPELALTDAMSWLPERIAAAARRARSAEITACLENVAGCWLHCEEQCPALPFRGASAPAGGSGPLAAARLELADAARVALAGGLRLLGVSQPARM